MIIDVHAHAILNLGHGISLAKQPDWSPDGALALLDAHGIAASILSVPDAANHAEGQQACDIARSINETLAAIVSKHPPRFGALAVLPGRDIEGALREMEYALDTLHLDGVSISTSIDEVFLGDARFDPLFAEMDRRGVVLFIHPEAVGQFGNEDAIGLNVSTFEFMFNTTRMLANMVLTGAKHRFPAIKMITTHGGGTMPFLMERFQTLVSAFGAGDGRAPIPAQDIRTTLSSFYYDLTATATETQLVGLFDFVHPSHLLMGFDAPLMPAATIAPAIERIRHFRDMDAAGFEAIAYGNAATLFPNLAQRMGVLPNGVREIPALQVPALQTMEQTAQ